MNHSLPSFGLAVSLWLLSLPSFAQVCQSPAEDRIFDTQLAVHPYSTPYASAVSPMGEFLFVNEGGGMAFIDDTLDQDSYENAKRVPVGTTGVVPHDLMLDPGANLMAGQAGGPNDVLHIAAGRFGLWVMEADICPGYLDNRAARVDDATLAGSALQDSRRWCNAVDYMVVKDRKYLLALFSEKNDNRLRVYKLQDVRDVLLPGTEFENELAPLVEVVLGAHPFQPVANTTALSFGLDLEVDQVGETGAEEASVYVALGTHGLARVFFDVNSLTAPVATPSPEFGPVFGDGTHYATDLSNPHMDLYNNLEFSDAVTTYRSDPPYFAGVAVENDGPHHFLYAAVDHLGWVRFKLTDEVTGVDLWADDMDIDHHEGVEDLTPWGDDVVNLVGSGGPRTYAHEIEMVKLGDPEQGVQETRVLAVGSARDHFLVGMPNTEGRTLSDVGRSFSGVPVVLFKMIEGETYVSLYNLDDPLTELTDNHASRISAGHGRLQVPPEQSGDAGEVVFFAGTFIEEYRASGNVGVMGVMRTDPVQTHFRGLNDRLGLKTLSIGHSILDPDILFFANNDGVKPDGILITDDDTIDVCNTTPGLPNAQSSFGSPFWNHRGQWEGPTSRKQYVWAGNQGVFRLARFNIRAGTCGPRPPVREMQWTLDPPADRFGFDGRLYFQGELNTDYDVANDQGWSMVFGTRSGVTEGVVVMDKEALTNFLEPQSNSGPFDVESIPGALVTQLNTHPEFDKVNPGIPAGDNFLRRTKISGAVATLAPKLFELSDLVSDRWVLGVPCGALAFDPAINPLNQMWVPDFPFNSYTHALVQFWDVQDPAQIPCASPLNAWVTSCTAELPPIIIPDPNNLFDPIEAPVSALAIETIELGGIVYCFILMNEGALAVYDITGLLQGTPPARFETHFATESLTDDIPCNNFALAIDRAQWSSGGEDFDEVYVYVAVTRVGIEGLRFDPTCGMGSRLQLVDLIQTPADPVSLVIREDQGVRTLLESDITGGARVFEYSNP